MLLMQYYPVIQVVFWLKAGQRSCMAPERISGAITHRRCACGLHAALDHPATRNLSALELLLQRQGFQAAPGEPHCTCYLARTHVVAAMGLANKNLLRKAPGECLTLVCTMSNGPTACDVRHALLLVGLRAIDHACAGAAPHAMSMGAASDDRARKKSRRRASPDTAAADSVLGMATSVNNKLKPLKEESVKQHARAARASSPARGAHAPRRQQAKLVQVPLDVFQSMLTEKQQAADALLTQSRQHKREARHRAQEEEQLRDKVASRDARLGRQEADLQHAQAETQALQLRLSEAANTKRAKVAAMARMTAGHNQTLDNARKAVAADLAQQANEKDGALREREAQLQSQEEALRALTQQLQALEEQADSQPERLRVKSEGGAAVVHAIACRGPTEHGDELARCRQALAGESDPRRMVLMTWLEPVLPRLEPCGTHCGAWLRHLQGSACKQRARTAVQASAARTRRRGSTPLSWQPSWRRAPRRRGVCAGRWRPAQRTLRKNSAAATGR